MSESGRTLAERTARRREAALAGHRGDAEHARTFLEDEDPVVRATALRALARANAADVALLARCSRDPEVVVRQATAELAARHPNSDVEEWLLVLLADTDATVAETAAWAAGERSGAGTRVIERLIELTTGHADALVREAAVAALGAVGSADGLPAILAATTDRATVRRRAVLALAPFDGPEVDAALRRALRDRDWQVRQAAEDLTS